VESNPGRSCVAKTGLKGGKRRPEGKKKRRGGEQTFQGAEKAQRGEKKKEKTLWGQRKRKKGKASGRSNRETGAQEPSNRKKKKRGDHDQWGQYQGSKRTTSSYQTVEGERDFATEWKTEGKKSWNRPPGEGLPSLKKKKRKNKKIDEGKGLEGARF